MDRFTNPYVILTLTALFWSSNMVVGRAFGTEVPPFAFAFLRWSVAALVVFPLAFPHVRAQWPHLKRSWPSLLLLGLLGVGGYNTLAYMGLQYTTATNAALLNSFIPIATIAISWIFFGKHLTRRESLGVFISFMGVMTIVGQGDVAVLAHLRLNVGDLWLLLAVLDWALYTIALGWRPAGVHPMALLAAMILVGLAALAPATLWEAQHGHHTNITPASLMAIAYVGIFPGFLSYVFYNRGVAAIGPSRASLFIHLMPVFGTLLAMLFLAEIPRWYHILGIALIFSGIRLTLRQRGR